MFVDIIPFLQDKKMFGELIEKIGEALTAPNIAARKWSLISFLVGIAIYVLMTIYMYFMFSMIDELYDNAYYYDYGYYDDYDYDDYGYDY
jgi:hypothetical protein